jgi:hypothetical protein
MRRALIIIIAAAFAVAAPVKGEALDLDAPLPPRLHAASPSTPSTVQLAQDLSELERYQLYLQRFHEWLHAQAERGNQ